MSEFWMPAVRDPSSRDLQRETRSLEDDKHLALLHLSVELTARSRSLDASVSIFLSPSVVTVVVTVVVVVFLIRVRVRRRRPTCIARGQRTGKSSHRRRRPRPGCRSRAALRTTNKNVISSSRQRVDRWDTTRRFSGGVNATVPCVFSQEMPVAFVSEHSFRDEPSEVNP